jgi:hypothetical protein
MWGTGGFRHVKVAVQVCFDRKIKMLFTQQFEIRHMLLERSIVHKNVDLAKIANCHLHRC